MKILFLCTGNSCRSQMAEGYARQLLSPEWEVYSAGIEAHGMNPYAIAAMAADGVDITAQSSKTVDAVPWQEMEVIVTVCGHAAESCPSLPMTARTFHWPLEDPAKARGTGEEIRLVYEKVRDEIRHRMRGLVAVLTAEEEAGAP